jgi:hypothetical protein
VSAVRAAILSLILVAGIAFSQDDGPHMNLDRMANTESVWMVLNEHERMQSLAVKVPRVTGGTALLCFRMPGEKDLDCFYRNDETGEVRVHHVQSSATGV